MVLDKSLTTACHGTANGQYFTSSYFGSLPAYSTSSNTIIVLFPDAETMNGLVTNILGRVMAGEATSFKAKEVFGESHPHTITDMKVQNFYTVSNQF